MFDNNTHDHADEPQRVVIDVKTIANAARYAVTRHPSCRNDAKNVLTVIFALGTNITSFLIYNQLVKATEAELTPDASSPYTINAAADLISKMKNDLDIDFDNLPMVAGIGIIDDGADVDSAEVKPLADFDPFALTDPEINFDLDSPTFTTDH